MCVYVLDVSVCVCVCGWIQWLEKMQLVYSSKAYEAGIYVCVCVGLVRLCVCVWLDTVARDDAGCLLIQGTGGWRLCVCMCWTCPSVCVCVCVCGWTQWLEKMQVVYSSKAQEAGVYVLEACGFDSIPAEMALLHATKQFDGRCHCLTHT